MSKKIQKGGIFIKNKKSKESIIYFIQNCKSIKLLSKTTTSGAVFECTLKEGVESPYEMIRSTNFTSPVKKIIVKLVGITSVDTSYYTWSVPKYDVVGFTPKRIEHEKTFEEEVNIQTQLFFHSMGLLNPWCPAPVYASVEKDKAAIDFINLMMRFGINSDTINVLNEIIRNMKHVNGKIEYLGILGMEIAEGYIGLYMYYFDYKNEKKKREQQEDPEELEDDSEILKRWIKLYENMTRLRILDIAIETGYSQADYHSGNILVNKDAIWSYDELPGNVLIIDFGLATKIPPEEMRQIKQLYREGELVQALKVLNTLTRSDGTKLNVFPESYGWLSYDFDNLDETALTLDEGQIAEENEKLLELKRKETAADDARVAFYNDPSHDGERNKYPLLPLSDAVENSFLEGIFSGGKRKNSKKKTQKNKTKKYAKRKQKRRKTKYL